MQPARPERRWRSWRSFSLRAVFALMTVAAIYAAAEGRYRQQARLGERVRALGGKVEWHPPLLGLPLPGWMRDIESIDLSRRQAPVDVIASLRVAPRLARLYLPRTELDDSALERIGQCRSLRRLAIWGNEIKDSGVARLEGLAQLEVLDLHETSSSQDCLSSLRGLPLLRRLVFTFPVDDQGLATLASMPRVELSPLVAQRVSDAGLWSLGSLRARELKSVELETREVSAAAVLEFLRRPERPALTGSLVLDGELTPECLKHLPWESLDTVNIRGRGIRLADLATTLSRSVGLYLSQGQYAALTPSVEGNGPDRRLVAARGTVWLSPHEESLAAAAPHLQQIRHAHLDTPSLDQLRLLASLPGLTHLTLDGPYPDSLVSELARLQGLVSLEINWCKQQQGAGDLASLRVLHQLEELTFYCTPYQLEDLVVLRALPNLRRATMYGADFDQPTLDQFLRGTAE